jgi:transketolase
MDRYGKSAPYEELFPYFGITADDIEAATRELLSDR